MTPRERRRQIILVTVVVVILSTVVLAQVTQGNFNAATGFSGRHGFTCTSCHNVPDMGPLGDDEVYDPPAQVTLDGAPSTWDVGSSYPLTITVTGGPPALPSPAPQGGFEIEADQGTFSVPSGMEEFIDVYADDGAAVTYTAAGTQMRSWDVVWHAPELDRTPGPTTLWVAAMAANGNHIVAAGLSDGGELGDSVDNLSVSVPPSQATLDAWEAVRLLPPVLDPLPAIAAFESFSLTGRHSDPAATHLAYRIDEGTWRLTETAETWRIVFDGGLTPGDHTLHLRSEGDGRASDEVRTDLVVDDALEEKATPFPFILTLVGLLVLATQGRWP